MFSWICLREKVGTDGMFASFCFLLSGAKPGHDPSVPRFNVPILAFCTRAGRDVVDFAWARNNGQP